jgi:tetratricopeptide (TPR) repeat protein
VELDLRLAAALGRFWLVRALYTEGREQLEAALSRVDDATPRQLRARVLTNLSGLAIMQGDADRAEACAEESLELSRELDDRIGVVGALTIIAHVQLQRGDIEGARVTYAETVELVRELNDPLRLASAIGNLGYVTIGLRDIPAARALFEEALALFTEHGNEEAAARSMLNVGFIAWSESRLEDARRSFLDALAIFRRLRGADGIAYVLEGLAAVAGSEGEHAAAARLLGGARVVREEIGLHLDPFEQEAHDETASAAAEALGHETFERTQAAAADEGVDAIVATLVASRGGPAVAAS